jgi:mono/diheme cytochrome c family protein
MPTVRSLTLSLALSLFATAGHAADAMQGGVLAKRWCSACHVVSVEQPSGTTQAPPFSAIARRADFNASQVAFFLLAPHPKMPDMSLTRNEAANLAAYIATQR